jgi:hypothetical protein
MIDETLGSILISVKEGDCSVEEAKHKIGLLLKEMIK